MEAIEPRYLFIPLTTKDTKPPRNTAIEIQRPGDLMTQTHVQGAGNPRHSQYLAVNSALMILVGLVCGLTVSSAPYPRKSVDQLLALLQVLDCDVDLIVRGRKGAAA
jgi:hypothetical protein